MGPFPSTRLELGDTPHHTDDRPDPVRIAYLTDPGVKFVLCLLTDRTRIYENDVSGILIRGDLKSVRRKRCRNSFRVGNIHLTAEGFEIDFLHRRARNGPAKLQTERLRPPSFALRL